MDVFIGVIAFLAFIDVAIAREYCYNNYQYKYCSYGCCGEYPNESCCSIYVWAIVLAVLGGIFFISFFVCIACCWYKKKGRQGQVMAAPQTGITTVNYVNTGFQPYNGYGQPTPMYQQPPGYQPQLQPPPPGYGQSSSFAPPLAPGYQPMTDAAYPPPPPKY